MSNAKKPQECIKCERDFCPHYCEFFKAMTEAKGFPKNTSLSDSSEEKASSMQANH